MQVLALQRENGILFKFTPDPEDSLSDGRVKFKSNDAIIETKVYLKDLHPDIIGIIALFIVGSFSEKITMDRPVSSKFAEAAIKYRKGKGFGPSSEDVEPLGSRPIDFRPLT